MIEQPRRGDGEDAWRRYAGELRQELGRMRAVLVEAEADARQLEERLAVSRERAAGWRRTAKRSSHRLNVVHRALLAGDTPSALDELQLRATMREEQSR